MAELKEKVNKLIKENKSSYKIAKDNSLKWHDYTLKDRKNKSVIKHSIGKKFKAGKIYRFTYDPTSDRLPYYDATPIILSLGRIKYKNSIAERGLNLNYLPADIRLYVMDMIHNSYKNSILNESKNKKANDAELQSGLPLSFNSLKVILGQVYAQYAIRNYTVTNMTDISSISYEYWDRAVLMQTGNFIGATLGKVHQDYYEYINQVINKRK